MEVTNGDSQDNRYHGSSIPDVYSARSVAEIKAALAELRLKDAAVTSQLDKLLASQKDLQRDLGRLDLLRANLSTQATKIRSISNGMLSDAASTASRISSSVKRLDLEQGRVKATLTVVDQVAELKACVLGVAGSMGAAQDWETAASYLSRASKIPKRVLEGDFAARIVPTAEVPDSPAVTLNNASESLCTLFLKEFDKAVKDGDGGKITRFFKLFPLINRSDVGLDVYGRYVRQGVATRARANLNAGTDGNQSRDGYFYANALTKLFEQIAQIAEGHGGLVERHYGPGRMIRVIERLQVEADMQGGIILDTWGDERRIDRQLTDIKSYPYTFLVQSFSASVRGSTGTPRAGSPAPTRTSEDEGVDMKQVDALLSEMSTMLSKWSLYTRFITEKCRPPDTTAEEVATPSFLLNSSLQRKVNDRLLSPFSVLTTFFFRRSVEKAFQLDEQPSDLSLNPHKPLSSSPPHITSAIEDIMYIVNKILNQSLSTCSLPLVLSTVSTITRILTGDFIGMQQRKMRDESYPRAAIAGSLPPEHLIVSFLVLINNLDVASTYITQIITSRLNPNASPTTHQQTPLTTLFPSATDQHTLNTTLTTLRNTFAEKTSELQSDGINVIFNNVLKPRLRPILIDTFRDTNYQLTQPETEDYLTALSESYPDTVTDTDAALVFSPEVRQRFALGWDALTRPIQRLMNEKPWDQLLGVTTGYLSKLLEKRVWTYSGRVNASGAARLEHDVNEVVRVACKGQKWGVRESFERVRQLCAVLGMDEEEYNEIEDGGGSWEGVAERLSEEERVRARGMVKEVD